MSTHTLPSETKIKLKSLKRDTQPEQLLKSLSKAAKELKKEIKSVRKSIRLFPK